MTDQTEFKAETRADGGVTVTRQSDGIEVKMGLPGIETGAGAAGPEAPGDADDSADDATDHGG